MNWTLLVSGVLFLLMGLPLFFFSPTIIHAFYDYTGLSNISIYQNVAALDMVFKSSQLSGFTLVVAGFIFIPLSRYYSA